MSLNYADKLTDEELRELISQLESSLQGMSVHRNDDEIHIVADVLIEDPDGSTFPATSSFTLDDYSFECYDYAAEDHRYELRRMLLAKFGPAYAEDYLMSR